MEDLWPSGAALRGEASNRLHAALAEDWRGERCRKRHPRGVRWGSGRPSAVPVRGSLLTRRYTVGFERSHVSFDNGPPRDMVLRVTHIYRRTDGEWKLIHRHADFAPPDQRNTPAR